MTESSIDLSARLESLQGTRSDIWTLTACGVTRSQRQIQALVDKDAWAPETNRRRLLMLGGLSGDAQDVELALGVLQMYAGEGKATSDLIALSAIPCANPDGLALGVGPENGAGGNPSTGYPPEGGFFFDERNPESRYLWRWICFQAPDVVVELKAGQSTRWEANAAASQLGQGLGASDIQPSDSLIAALGTGSPDNLGVIPGLRLTASPENVEAELRWFMTSVRNSSPGKSPARQTLDRRRARTAVQIARALDAVYGHTLEPVIYTQGVAISGRLRLQKLDPNGPDPVPGIVELVERYVSGGGNVWGDNPGGANLAGVVWGDDLAEATGDSRYNDIVIKAADHYQNKGKGIAPPPADVDFRTEDMFMCGAILGRAFKITGDSRYIDILTQFILDTNIQQDDGLFWHCRSAPYYWGRGNGFALLGLTETLTYLPEDHPDRDAIIAMCRKELDGLRPHQSASGGSGMFLQVIDFPGSYQEHTATSMIGYSIARGLRRGWLPDGSGYEPMLRLAWQGISERVDDDGNVVDGCTGTGVQENLRQYLDRAAIFGFDDRTGNMALWFSIEMESFLRGI
jgi:rhamnogalacturonyl hydrolase YesR